MEDLQSLLLFKKCITHKKKVHLKSGKSVSPLVMGLSLASKAKAQFFFLL